MAGTVYVDQILTDTGTTLNVSNVNFSTSGQFRSVAGSASAPGISVQNNTDTGIFFPAANTIAFAEGGVEAMRITSSGNVLIGVTSATSGGGVLEISNGITFPATQQSSTNANTLDDYEEGDWTPTLGGTATYTARYGKYTKIGNIVTCQFRIQVNTIGTGSVTTLDGFPFVAANISDVQTGGCSYFATLAANTSWLSFYIQNNSTSAIFVGQNAVDGTCTNAITLFGNGAHVYGTITYRVA